MPLFRPSSKVVSATCQEIADIAGASADSQMTTRALRSVTKGGGLDAYLLSVADAKLAPEGLRLKRAIKRVLRGRPAAAPPA